MVKGVEPLIIPRKEHRISRKQVSPNALRTLYRLNANGFIAYLVGGCVRDLLLGRTPKDFDIERGEGSAVEGLQANRLRSTGVGWWTYTSGERPARFMKTRK